VPGIAGLDWHCIAHVLRFGKAHRCEHQSDQTTTITCSDGSANVNEQIWRLKFLSSCIVLYHLRNRKAHLYGAPRNIWVSFSLVARILKARDTTFCVSLYGVRMQALNEQIWRLKFLSSCIVLYHLRNRKAHLGSRDSSCCDWLRAMSCTCAGRCYTRLTSRCVSLYGVRMQALSKQIWRLKFLSSCIAVSLFRL
jgi:hypothetical protein